MGGGWGVGIGPQSSRAVPEYITLFIREGDSVTFG